MVSAILHSPNGTATARICHIGSCHHIPLACRSHSTTLSLYIERKFVHVVFQVSCVETTQDASSPFALFLSSIFQQHQCTLWQLMLAVLHLSLVLLSMRYVWFYLFRKGSCFCPLWEVVCEGDDVFYSFLVFLHCKKKWVVLIHFGYLSFIPFSTWLDNFISKLFSHDIC